MLDTGTYYLYPNPGSHTIWLSVEDLEIHKFLTAHAHSLPLCVPWWTVLLSGATYSTYFCEGDFPQCWTSVVDVWLWPINQRTAPLVPQRLNNGLVHDQRLARSFRVSPSLFWSYRDCGALSLLMTACWEHNVSLELNWTLLIMYLQDGGRGRGVYVKTEAAQRKSDEDTEGKEDLNTLFKPLKTS